MPILNAKVRAALTLVVTAAAVLVATAHSESERAVLGAVLVAGAALGIVPAHLEVTDAPAA